MLWELEPRQWRDAERGRVIGPDGMAYTSRLCRIAPHVGAALIAAGSPLLLCDTLSHRLTWCDGHDAITAWEQRREDILGWTTTIAEHHSVRWIASRWESNSNEALVVLSGPR